MHRQFNAKSFECLACMCPVPQKRMTHGNKYRRVFIRVNWEAELCFINSIRFSHSKSEMLDATQSPER